MNMLRHLSFVIIPLFISFESFSQSGIVRGTVIEDATGETLYGVTVVVSGTTNGSVTDFDGKFEIKLARGTYDIQVSFVSFQTVTITGVEIKPDKVTVIDQLRLKESVEELEAVVVTADVIKDSESALLTVKRKSANLLDGISSASFRKIGDSDAARAIKRVTGVSVEGGKYVYVRGLGDRYTKTTLNNVDIPGLDPDRNSLQIDIFPTNLIDNMIVSKTALAENPADFTGGVVNIETKDFPEEKIFDVSASIGFNPSMHFNNDYFTYDGSSTDWMGYDNGVRDIPDLAKDENIPRPGNSNNYTDAEINSFISSFNPTLGPTKNKNFMDYSLGLSLANQIAFRGNDKLGYIFSATYKNNVTYYDDAFYGEYQRDGGPTNYELVHATTQEGQLTEQSVLMGALGGLAYKTGSSKYRLTLMHLQNGEKRAGNFFIDDNGSAVGKSGFTADSYNLGYNQRGLTNLLLNGEHHIADNTWEIDWRISPTFATIEDPDIRKTAFTLNGFTPAFDAGNAGNPTRIWRFLNEINAVGKIDISKEYGLFGSEAKLKFGFSHVYKERDYEIFQYDLQRTSAPPTYSGDPNEVLIPELIYPNGVLYYSSVNSMPNSNEYNSNVHNSGAYISNDFKFIPKLKAAVGLRVENYVQRHTGRDQTFANGDSILGRNLINEKVLDSFDFFPSVNLIYSITENQNLRASYSRTIARPSFKELSYAQIADPLTNRIFNGSFFTYPDWDGRLTETRISNYDLRWEVFPKRSELLSISGFYKTFERPIELVRIPQAQTSNEFQPRNVGDGQVLGFEVEFAKSLDFIAPSLTDFKFNGNLTFVRSQIELTGLEFEARKNYEKEGQTIEGIREMAGQAPYIINGGISYENLELDFDAGFFYNVKGPTLVVVGGGLFPDVYSEPFHSLNFNLNKSLGAEKKTSININVANILNDLREEFYTGFQSEERPFTRLNPGRTFSVGIKHSF